MLTTVALILIIEQSQVRTEVGGEQKTQNYDVSSLIGDGVSVTSVSSSPLVSAMMISIVLNLVNFSILYYQVKWTIEKTRRSILGSD